MHIFWNLLIGWLVLFASVSYAGWTPPVRISEEATSFGPRIVANGDTLHVVYWRGGGYISTYYLRSENGGGTWEEPFLLADTSSTSNSISPVIRSSGELVAAIWRYTAGPSRWNFGFRGSNDGGESWGDILAILPIDNHELQKHTFYLLDSTIFFIYSRRAQDLIFELTKSNNWGETWTEPIEVFRTQETGLFDMVARGDSIHVVWPGRFDDDHLWETYYLKSENAGEDWTDNLLLTTLDDRGSMWPSISMNERGEIIVCWVDFKYSPYWWTGDLFIRYSHDAGQSWTEEEQITFTHLAIAPRVIWQGDSIHVAWEDHRHDQADIFCMISTDNGSSWGEEQRTDDINLASLAPDLAVVGDNIRVVWREDEGVYGRGIYYSRWEREVGVVDDPSEPFPDELNLVAYPNPFNSSTTITYIHLEGGEIEIFNIAGQKIRTFITSAKEGRIVWDARDALGNKISCGIYFARARAPRNYYTIKLIYLK